MNNKKPLIIGNWKCNPASQKQAEHLLSAIKGGIEGKDGAEVVICPPFVYLSEVIKSVEDQFSVGAQDCFWENKGAFTGEISPLELKNLGCQYVLVGHSERRRYLKETDEMINKELKAALKVRLKPILCVGEKDRDVFNSEGKLINEMSLIVSEQVEKGLNNVPQARITDVVIAYEPVWAIGSGIPCLPDDAMKAALLIKKTLTGLYNRSIAERVKILYGGSVMSQNAADYIKEANLDGLLIGGASLNASEFIKIVNRVIE